MSEGAAFAPNSIRLSCASARWALGLAHAKRPRLEQLNCRHSAQRVPTARARRGLLSSRRLVQGGRRLDSAHGHRGRSRTPYAWLSSSALACPAPRRLMHSSCVASCCRRLALARSSRRWEPGTACRHFQKQLAGEGTALERERMGRGDGRGRLGKQVKGSKED